MLVGFLNVGKSKLDLLNVGKIIERRDNFSNAGLIFGYGEDLSM